MKLTPDLKKEITSDWQALVPQFTAYKTMSFARRIGPLIQGIYLDRDSTNAAYLPTLHIHCLCRPFPVVSLSLSQPLQSPRSGTVERLSGQFHKAKYQEACTRLVASSVLPMTGDWTMAQVLAAHEAYRRLDRPDSRYPVLLMEDAVSLWTWLGAIEKAESLALRYLDQADDWPENVLTRQGGLNGWRQSLLSMVKSVDTVRKVVDEQIAALKLQKVPVSQLFP
jgi:hypothetical protein